MIEIVSAFALKLAQQGFHGPFRIEMPKSEWMRFLAELGSLTRYGVSDGHNNGVGANEIEVCVGPIRLKLVGVGDDKEGES